MTSNARVKLSLQITLCNFINLFISLHVMRRDMMSDIQYGRLKFLQLSTGHGYQSDNQTWETED